MNLFILNVFLSMAWTGLTGEFTPMNFVVGFVLGYLILWPIYRDDPSGDYFKKVFRVMRFLIFFIQEVILSNLRVMREALSPGRNIKPGIVAVELDAKTDLEITLFANLITLTPGTLSMDVSEDRKMLFVHAMFIDDPDVFKRNLKQSLEKRLLEVLR